MIAACKMRAANVATLKTDTNRRTVSSSKCNSAAHQLKRRLRADGYLRLEIANRDFWNCGICKLPIDQALKHPDPGFGSLDHIVPRSQGGSHEPHNLRIVHLVCNLSRRDDFDPAELLVGPSAMQNLLRGTLDA